MSRWFRETSRAACTAGVVLAAAPSIARADAIDSPRAFTWATDLAAQVALAVAGCMAHETVPVRVETTPARTSTPAAVPCMRAGNGKSPPSDVACAAETENPQPIARR